MFNRLIVKFSGDRVGLIVRGMSGPDERPWYISQHADCILSDGTLIGFFGDGPGGSSASGRSISGGSGSSGFGLGGHVFDKNDYKTRRPQYINIDSARSKTVLSTVILVPVSQKQAKLYSDAWVRMKQSPGAFAIVGNNCATHASITFRQAEILSSDIPGIDTPVNLFRQLRAQYASRALIYSGYIGFISDGAGSAMQVDPN